MSQVCVFRHEVDTILQRVQMSSLHVTEVFHLSERLVAALSDPSRCDDGCYQSMAYAEPAIKSVARLMDLLDSVWSTTSRQSAFDQAEVMHNDCTTSVYRNLASTSDRPGSYTATPAVFGHNAAATVGKFILDDSERDILLQELLRSSMVSMNNVVADIHQRIFQCSRPSGVEHRLTGLDLGHLGTLSGHLLERTYSSLAKYENQTML